MTERPYRILVTGSRDWTDQQTVYSALAEAVRELSADREVVIVHGACPTGADYMAHEWARGYGAVIEAHPANWVINGRRAGFIRNARMVNLGADVCLAFIKDGSRGASHTARLAEQAGIPVRRFTA
ncbi:DUF2493 domain-containing protein [Streptomyces sp. NPDC020298]|uniref:DUF2493 domain-containing protein n=1 Tax=unclassified Streptomyces TaxID=2593676 RepID=UPI0033E75D45